MPLTRVFCALQCVVCCYGIKLDASLLWIGSSNHRTVSRQDWTNKKASLTGRTDLDSGFEGIHQTEGGHVGPAVLELLQVGQVEV